MIDASKALPMKPKPSSRSLAFAASLAACMHATAALPDATLLRRLDAYMHGIDQTQEDLIALTASADAAQRFHLYATVDRSIATALQVDFVCDAIEAEIAAGDAESRDLLRAQLDDHARFALWELDANIAGLEHDDLVVSNGAGASLAATLLDLLRDVRDTVRLLVDGAE